jgi:hypothetical protein
VLPAAAAVPTVALCSTHSCSCTPGRYKVPLCEAPFASCNSGPLLLGRGQAPSGIERNAPNTLDGCADGDAGVYSEDPSVEYINVRSLSGATIKPESAVTVEAKVHCKDASDVIALFHSASASTPDWRLVSEQVSAAHSFASMHTCSAAMVIANRGVVPMLMAL